MKEVRFTIPVTSPKPVVVAELPIERVKLPISRMPTVADGFELARFRMPFIEISFEEIIPPAPLMDKLFRVVEKIPEGKVIVEELAKINVEADAFN